MAEPQPSTNIVQWVTGGVVLIIGALWAALQSGRSKEIVRLEAALKHEQDERKTEADKHDKEIKDLRDEHKQNMERLGKKLDDANAEAERAKEKMVSTLLLARRNVSEPEVYEEEAPTDVHKVLDLIPRSTSDPALRAVRARAEAAAEEELTPRTIERIKRYNADADSNPPDTKPLPPRPWPRPPRKP